MTTAVLEGAVARDALAAGPYLALPFDVPAETTRIDVTYRYDDGHILDLGLVDTGIGGFPSREGFRGWSGSARAHVYVARDDATPGYLPGEIGVGTWQVVLGLAHLGPRPCHYHVEIVTDSEPRQAAAEPRPRHVRVPGPRWFRGDLHSHTHYSDARGSLADLLAAARARRLDFLAVTDHNTVGHHAPARAASAGDLVILPGEEITTYRGHANVWGVPGWVDFRITRPGDVESLVAHVHARGGLFAVNHARTSPGCIGCDWEHPIPDALDAFEAWNGPWSYRNWEALERYDALLRRGLRPTLIGGSDRHQPGWPDTDPELLWVGSPTTWFHLEELSETTLLQGLSGGRAFVSEGPEGPHLELEVEGVGMGSTVRADHGRPLEVKADVAGASGSLLRYVAARGLVREVVITSERFSDRFAWSVDGPFLRAEVLAMGDEATVRGHFEMLRGLEKIPQGLTLGEVLAHPRRRALSNPVYIGSSGEPGVAAGRG